MALPAVPVPPESQRRRKTDKLSGRLERILGSKNLGALAIIVTLVFGSLDVKEEISGIKRGLQTLSEQMVQVVSNRERLQRLEESIGELRLSIREEFKELCERLRGLEERVRELERRP